MSKADRFKNLNKDDDMLSNLLGVQPEELTEEQQQAKELINLVNSFKDADKTDEEAVNKLLADVKAIVGNERSDNKLTPSTEERVIAEGGNSRTNKKETKSRRMNMLFRPTAYAEFQKLAIIKQTSANDLMNTIVENVIEENAEVLEAYDKLNDLAK